MSLVRRGLMIAWTVKRDGNSNQRPRARLWLFYATAICKR